MPDFNAHGLDPTWAEPEAERVQAFFDNLSERYVCDEPLLIRDTTQEELAYIAARAEETALAEKASSLGTMENEADAAAEEKEFAEWTGSAGEASGAGAGAPLVEEVAEESVKEETKADDSSAPGRKRVLRWAGSSEPVRPDRTAQRQQAQARPVRQTRAAAAKKFPDPSSMDQVDVDAVIEEVAKDAEAEATKIAAGEAAKSAAEEAGKGPAGETSEAAAGEAGKGPAGESGEATAEEAVEEPAGEGAADDQPSSSAAPRTGKYLKVGYDLFIRLPGTADTRAPAEGEVFDDEALATAGLQDKVISRTAAVDKAEADFQERIAQMQVRFDKARQELKDTEDQLDERKRELLLK
nr:tol-Pal system protein TolA-like [Aegilops tauschii subsp. strangulata]